jgi:Kdo2-lipid IVA lauroyltransferase/acyltransferase
MNVSDRFIGAFQYWGALGMIQLVRFMPYPAALALGRFIGFLLWAFMPLRRRIVSIQMQAALDMNDVRFLAMKVFMNQGEYLVDSVKYAFMTTAELRKKIIVEGKEHLDEALAARKGLMFVIGHIGNWEILSHAAQILNVEVCVMADMRKNERLEAVVDGIRSRSGATILPPSGKGLMLIKELKKGRSIAFMVDQHGKRKGRLLCDIFGLPALTNPAPAFFAIKGDALVMPVYIIKEKGLYYVRFHQAVEASVFGQDKDAIQPLSDYMQSFLTSVIKSYPDQWFWVHSRWMTRAKFKKNIHSPEEFKAFVRAQAEKLRADML